jgi:hypothetical protein
VATRALAWSGLKGGTISVGFDDGHFGPEQMRAEIALVGQAYPSLPDEVPPGTSFVFGRDGTGHLTARFKVGTTVYRSGGQRDLHRLWDSVDLIERLLRLGRLKLTSQIAKTTSEEATWTTGR